MIKHRETIIDDNNRIYRGYELRRRKFYVGAVSAWIFRPEGSDQRYDRCRTKAAAKRQINKILDK